MPYLSANGWWDKTEKFKDTFLNIFVEKNKKDNFI